MPYPSLEDEFWADPRNAPQYDPDTLQTTFAPPPDIPDEEEEAIDDVIPTPSGRHPLQIPEEKPAEAAPHAAPAKKGRGWSPNFLAAAAAFTQNPALLQMLKEQQDAPERKRRAALQASADSRAQQKWELERDLLTPLKADKLKADTRKAATWSDMNAIGVASTPESAEIRRLVADRIEMQASRLPDGDEKRIMLSTAANMRSDKSPASGIEAQKIARGLRVDASDIMRDAQNKFKQGETSRMNDAKIADMGEKNKQAWARINAARERALQPKEPSERVKAAQAKNQEKLDDEIEKAEWARGMLLSVAGLKKNVNTGPIAGRAQNFLQDWGLSSEDFDKLKSRLAKVSNRIIKELSGSAVTGNEWQRMQDELANILNDDRNFDSKLADMIELTESIKQRAINRYSRTEDGAPSDTTNTAARMTGGKPRVRATETPPPDATPGRKASTGAESVDPDLAAKIATAKKIAADPNHPKNAKAKAWLKQNGQ